MADFSFIKLYKNDFNSAKLADDTPIVKLKYNGFLVQKPNEYFVQTTNSDVDISFAGGIQVDLVNCSNIVKQNIDANFFPKGFVDENGISQISFAFGFVGIDYWTEQLYLKITDLINGNVWYSNGFLVTYYRTELSTRFDYFNPTKIYGISYDLAPYYQSIRILECYDQTPTNKRDVKQYVNSNGKQVNYRSITTFLRKYLIDFVDYFINDRLEVLFSHAFVYANGQRVVVSDYKVDERAGDTNWMTGEFTINPQNETLVITNPLYQFLSVLSKTPIHQTSYTVATMPIIELTFNKNISVVPTFNVQLYKDNVLQTITPFTYTITGNIIELTPTFTWVNGAYTLIIDPDLIYSGSEQFEGFGAGAWTWTVSSGDFDNTEFNNEFLLN